MKTIFSIFLTIISISTTYAQVSITTDGSAPHSSAILDVKSNTKAFYPPRMGVMQKETMLGVQAGAMVFDTDLQELSIYNGTVWKSSNETSFPIIPSSSYLISNLPNDPNLINNNFTNVGKSVFYASKPVSTTAISQKWMEAAPFLKARIGPKIISTSDNKFIVYGGFDGYNFFSDGAIYDMLTNSWTAIPDMGDGIDRRAPIVVLADNKLIVWGGSQNGFDLSSGRIYNFTSKTWSSMSNASAPVGRIDAAYGYNAATSEFVVWGGDVASTSINTGAKYNLNTNTWTAISTVGAPTERASVGFSLNEGKLFVFGGKTIGSPITYHSTAFYYNVASNTWSALPSAGLVPRALPHVVFTGTAYIVFGGNDSVTFQGFLNGKIFNTSTNLWSNMADPVSDFFDPYQNPFIANGYFMFKGQNDLIFRYRISNNTWDTSLPLPNTLNFDLQGNSLGLFSIEGGLEHDTMKISRFFWVGQSITKNVETPYELYLYKKN